VRHALHRLLVTMGFAVASYGSAEAFLRRGDPWTFGCLLVDFHLGGMNGAQLAEVLSRAGLRVPVIFMSAAADAVPMVRRKMGRDAVVLRKPVDANQLWSALVAATSERRMP